MRSPSGSAAGVIGVKVEVPAGVTFRSPRVGHVAAGPPVVFMVELLPGQVPSEVGEPARRVALALGARSARLEPIAGRWVRVVVPDPDPPADHDDLLHRGSRRVRTGPLATPCTRRPRVTRWDDADNGTRPATT